MHPLLDDPWIAAEVDAAVAPYVGRLSDREVAWMRDQLAEVLASDETAARLARRARPPVVDQSGEVRRDAGGAATPIPVAPPTPLAAPNPAPSPSAPVPITAAKRAKKAG